MTIPRQDGKPFAEHQAEMAEWLGYGADVRAMNAVHDALHADLCNFLGVASQSLRMAAGEALTGSERILADVEEEAVQHCQRLQQMTRRAA